jgi:hypothetical protein
MKEIYDQLKHALKKQIQQQNLFQKKIRVRCNVLSAAEAIGSPEHDDYPIVKGREVMVEASFNGARGQAFTDEFENMDLAVEDLLTIDLDTNKNRAVFISGLNAVYRHLGLCKKTVHCRDAEPGQCASALPEIIGTRKKVLLVGHQPRFLEKLASIARVRAVDLDPDNIGKIKSGIEIEPPSMMLDAAAWCDTVFATGSTVVNGTISEVIDLQKPVIFYGVTISAAAEILQLRTYCHCGH